MKFVVWDTETYPNFFSAGFEDLDSDQKWVFEISPRRDDGEALWHFLHDLIRNGTMMIGYNNLSFDYPVIHEFLLIGKRKRVTAMDMYLKAQAIIDADWSDWSHHIWESDMLIKQIDPLKIMHFDNHARRTSLKKLEVAMKSDNVEGLPHPPGTDVPPELYDPMIYYMQWDVSETKKFTKTIWDRIEFRMELDRKYGGRNTRINYNDTKIGKEHFLSELKSKGIEVKSFGSPIQTPRHGGIKVADILLPIQFDHPALQGIYQHFQQAVIPPSETKGFFTNLSAELRGIRLDFGSGGIHGSIHKRTVTSDDTHVVLDCDVTSYYPSLAIQYRQYPQHLGEQFVDIYADLKNQRVAYPKGSPENAMLKLALNGTYGESNNKYSSFYDPQFTMFITINGQLLLARLMEVLLANPEVEPIQINTDGLTIRLPRAHLEWYHQVCEWWSKWSRMDLEFVEYAKMSIRDVNGYIAIDTKGKVKRKNDYSIDPDWHQDHSSLIVPKAVSQYVEHGIPLDMTIYTHADPYDFMRSVKVPNNSTLVWGDQKVQNVTRYHIAVEGHELVKIMPPLPGKDDTRLIAIDKGWRVQVCNKVADFRWDILNHRWYLNEAEKLLKGLGL